MYLRGICIPPTCIHIPYGAAILCQEVHIEKLPDDQMPFDDDELNEEYTLDDNDHDIESDNGDGDDYVENQSDTEENFDSEIISEECSSN